MKIDRKELLKKRKELHNEISSLKAIQFDEKCKATDINKVINKKLFQYRFINEQLKVNK